MSEKDAAAPRRSEAELAQAREAIVREAVACMTEKSFSTCGLDEILARTDTPKGSFYLLFDGKESFGLAAIDMYAQLFVRRMQRCFSDTRITPMQRLDQFIAESRAGMAKYEFTRGCLVGNLGQEMSVLPESLRHRLIDVFSAWEHHTSELLREAQRVGEISDSADCRRLAEAFWIGWEGAVLRAKLQRIAGPLDCFADHFYMSLGVSRSDVSAERLSRLAETSA